MAATPSNPGWYPDPEGRPATQRWWDGGSWSPVTRPDPNAPPAPAAPPAPQPPAYGPPPTPGYGPPPAYGTPGGASGSPYATAGREVATPDGVPLAGFGARLVARAIDWVLKSALAFALGFRLLTPATDAFREWFDSAVRAAEENRPAPAFDVLSDLEVTRALGEYQLLATVVAALYTVLLLRWRGATLGKLLLGIRVRSWQQDGRLTWSQCSLRWLTGEGLSAVPFFSFFWPLLNYLWPLWDRRRQAIHDKLPQTVVVRTRVSVPTTPGTPAGAPWP